MLLCAKTMAFKKFISMVLFILILLFASKVEGSGRTETSQLGVISRVVSSWLATLAATITVNIIILPAAIVENFFCAALLAVSKGV
ncbi:hypothetical protein ACB092_12G025500 [Castanea dentata]